MSVFSAKYEYRFVCPLPNGLHARPANRLEQVVAGFSSAVSVVNLSNRKVANAHSVLSLVGADIKAGDECLLCVDGEDGGDAYAEIVRFLREEFPVCDESLEAPSAPAAEAYLPPVLRAAGVAVTAACGVAGGFGRGRAVLLQALRLPEQAESGQPVRAEAELKALDQALVEQRGVLIGQLVAGRQTTECEVLRAHLAILNDVELLKWVQGYINEQGCGAGKAILAAYEYFAAMLGGAESELIRERVADLQDVCAQLLKRIYGGDFAAGAVLTGPSVCIADNLTPAQFMALDKSRLAGLALVHGSMTSHTVILARSFGIPTLTGLKAAHLPAAGREVIVDANHGLLIAEINPAVERFYAAEQRKRDYDAARQAAYADQPARTRDGAVLGVLANVASADEVELAIARGAEGIGLFRTEMLFMGRESAPTEAEQFEAYRRAAHLAGGRPVTIRTFDVGGDKPVGYLKLPAEENPFLGCRGVRVYRRHELLFRTQLRAILRASAFGRLKIMIPMVACVEEVDYVRGVLEEVKAELDGGSVAYDRTIELGIMVEVPAVAWLMGPLARRVRFLSIGTNDLAQYVLAADRGNECVSGLYRARHPGLLALLKQIVDGAHREGLAVSLCGELAGRIENLPLLLGLGLDAASVSIPLAAPLKAACRRQDRGECVTLLERALAAETAGQIDALLADYRGRAEPAPVIDARLVELDADCLNKEEVIKQIADLLYLNGRTDNAAELEKDFWRREAVYSTGLGYGFAIPHCKSAQAACHTLSVLRLRQPVAWGSIDEKPVDTVIAMTIREGGQAGADHLRIFSRLARQIMHESFREQLRTLPDADRLVTYLQDKLELAPAGAGGQDNR